MASLSAHQYSARDASLNISTTGDVFQLVNGSTRTLRIMEVRIGQTNLTSLELLALQFVVGTGGGTGTGLTEYEWNADGPAATAAAASRQTGFVSQVASVGQTLDYGVVWNILQEFVWLPHPDLEIIVPPSTNFAWSLGTTPSGPVSFDYNVVWQES